MESLIPRHQTLLLLINVCIIISGIGKTADLADSSYNETTCGVQAVKLGFGQKVIAYTYFTQSKQVRYRNSNTFMTFVLLPYEYVYKVPYRNW